MKITKEQLKKIIKEELSVVLNENDLINNDGWERLLQSFRFIRGDLSSPLDSPWNQAEILKQALRKKITDIGYNPSDDGFDAIKNLNKHIEVGHESLPSGKALEDLKGFLKWAEGKLSGK